MEHGSAALVHGRGDLSFLVTLESSAEVAGLHGGVHSTTSLVLVHTNCGPRLRTASTAVEVVDRRRSTLRSAIRVAGTWLQKRKPAILQIISNYWASYGRAVECRDRC